MKNKNESNTNSFITYTTTKDKQCLLTTGNKLSVSQYCKKRKVFHVTYLYQCVRVIMMYRDARKNIA